MRFVHVNLVARHLEELALFYQRVFGCAPVPPRRRLSGPWLDAATGIPEARIEGVHLRLPGNGGEGPTLEIFQYNPEARARKPTLNRPGLAHLAFQVEDVTAARDAVLAGGGSAVGEIVQAEVPGAGTVEFIYARDPEGNLLELQRWSTNAT